MIVVISQTNTIEVDRIIKELNHYPVTTETVIGKDKIVIGLVGDTSVINPQQIQQISPFIEQVIRVKQPFKPASLEFHYSNGYSRPRQSCGYR